MNEQIAFFAVLCIVTLAGCRGASPTPAPLPTATAVPATATPVPTDTPSPTALPTATRTPLRTATRTRATAMSTRPRLTATHAPTATPPDTMSDGNYSSSGTVRLQFTISGSGALATNGFFNFHCPVDGALETYAFSSPAALVGGKFGFSAEPDASGAPRVTMVCSAVALTQARCTIRDLLATNKCLDTAATASRK